MRQEKEQSSYGSVAVSPCILLPARILQKRNTEKERQDAVLVLFMVVITYWNIFYWHALAPLNSISLFMDEQFQTLLFPYL